MRSANLLSGDLSLMISSALSNGTKEVAIRMDTRNASVLILIGGRASVLLPQLRHYQAPQETKSKASTFFRIAAINRHACFYFHSIFFCRTALSLFRRHWESRFSFPARTVVGNFHVPITGHVDLDFAAIQPSGSCALNHHVSMNLRARHVAVDLKIDFANIDKASLGIAKLDRCFVVTLTKMAVAI